MKALLIVAAMIVSNLGYQYFMADKPDYFDVASQAWWSVLTIIGLWGFGCLK